jgi:transcription elongation factor GreA
MTTEQMGYGSPYPHLTAGAPMTQSSEQTTVWLTQKTFDRLNGELEELRGPKRAEVIARISQLEEMLRHVTTEPAVDDGMVSPGKLVTYRYAGDDDADTFLLGAREIDDDETDIEVFSPQSPLGAALVGAATGETIDFEAPNGKKLKIEIVAAKPYTG